MSKIKKYVPFATVCRQRCGQYTTPCPINGVCKSRAEGELPLDIIIRRGRKAMDKRYMELWSKTKTGEFYPRDTLKELARAFVEEFLK